MNVNNPYAQAGWSNSANPNAVNVNGSGSSPSTFGALPYSAPPSSPPLLTFLFTAFTPDILNSTLLGPQSRPYLRVVTDTATSGHSIFQNTEGNTVALIEWQQHPVVEVSGIVSRRYASQWLGLAPDRSSRLMEARGRRYVWVPQENFICMYTTGSASELLARVTRNRGSVTLEMSPQAIQFGLFEVCVAATVLLQCGRNID